MTELEGLGARIALYRGARSQRDLATATGLDVSTISRIERGITDPTYGTLSKIRTELNVTWDALILGDSDKIVPDALLKMTDGTEITVEMRVFQSGPDRETAEKEAAALRRWIELSHRLDVLAKRSPPKDHPPEDFLDRAMSPEQAARLATLAKYEFEQCEQESFEANVREFANVLGRDDLIDTFFALALGESRWVPKATVLLAIAGMTSKDRELALPLLQLETEDGSFDAVLDAWEHEVAKERARREKPAASKAAPELARASVPLTDSEIETLREFARRDGPLAALAHLNERLGDALQILAEGPKGTKTTRQRQKHRPQSS